jgi:outer membrane immunogenic protein
MNRTVVLASSALVSMFVAQGALAGDWTGFYVGIHAGGAFGDTDITTISQAGTNGFWEVPNGGSFDLSREGVLGGAQLGYNHEFSGWVLGFEATGSGMDFDETIPLTTDDVFSVESEWLATAALRVGFLVGPTSLLYVKGGYAAGDVQTNEVDTSGDFLGRFSTDETHSGWIAGAGFEEMISPDVSFGVEYNYIDLGSQDHTGVVFAPAVGGPVVNEVDVQTHVVTARLNWHFWP